MFARTLTFLLFFASLALASTKYVAPGASGSGASWSSPASTAIINSSAAGDLIYLAGGAYGGGIPVQASGSAGSPITIRKATLADHGADPGWTTAMDLQATFSSGWSITAHDIVVDGNNWKPPGLPAKFGIAIRHASGSKGIDAGGSSGNLVIRDVDVGGPGINASKAEADGIHFPSNTTISGCAVHDTDALCFAWKGTSNAIFEYSLLYNASSNIVYSGNPQDPHPDVIYSGAMLVNSIMRYCMVANVTSEGVFFDSELPNTGSIEFYGNIMFQGDCQTGNTPIQLQNGGAFGTVKLYHNTFVDFNKSNNLGPGTTVANGSAVVNNLFVNYLPNWNKGVDTNGFSSTGIGTNQIVNAASPFVTSGQFKWVKGSGTPPATRVVTGAPTGYNPSGMEAAFALADTSWAKGKAVAVPSGRNVDLFGNTGNALGAIQSGTSPAPTPSATPSPSASPSATPSPVPTASPSPGQPKFVAGDYVVPTAALNVRETPAGTVVGQHLPGDVGRIVSGPTLAPLNGTSVSWYLISWPTPPAEGYSGDDDLIKTVGPSPTPSPSASPTPVTYKAWTTKLNTNQSDWIEAHPPYPDGE
jgi:hypothetical protein